MRVPLALGAIVALAMLGGCSGGGGTGTPTPAGATATPAAQAIVCNASGEGGAVDISNFAFNPASANVAVGKSIIFTNNDGTTHTVTFDNGPDCGSVSGGGASQTVQFTVAGSFAYHCKIHPSMKGTVVVS